MEDLADEADDASPPVRPTAEPTTGPEADLADDADDVSLPTRPTVEVAM
jgi:hypothetical protein